MTMLLDIEESKVKKLSTLAQHNGETTEHLITEVLSEYLNKNYMASEHVQVMKLSEPSFAEWNNKEDAIYDTL
ncbi:MAG: hypothetical protein KGZ58_11960 [Ignavibacteriales bacterium]|nr:hypothetical protein [Ignavibacteriales bacterium]